MKRKRGFGCGTIFIILILLMVMSALLRGIGSRRRDREEPEEPVYSQPQTVAVGESANDTEKPATENPRFPDICKIADNSLRLAIHRGDEHLHERPLPFRFSDDGT